MSTAIRFHRYGGPDELVLDEVPPPEPGPGQVRVAVVTAGVNPVDCRIRRGELAAGAPLPGPRGVGTDVAGVVDAVGPGVTGLAVGDEVFGRAAGDGYGELALAAVDDLLPRPPELAWDVAGSVAIPGETAYRTLGLLGVTADRTAGTTLLVHGASGGVGAVAARLAVLRGARVLGTAGPGRLDQVRDLGAEPLPYGDGWVARVRALAPDGVDAVLDTAGKGVLADSIALTGRAEAVVTIADRDADRLGVRYSRGLVARVPMAEVFAELLPLLRTGALSVRVAVRLPLAEAAQAHHISEHGHPGGRIVLVVRDPPGGQSVAGTRNTASTPASSR